MKPAKVQVSSCSFCRHYIPQGRRGGHCEQLNVPVQSRWQACSLSLPTFTSARPALELLETLPHALEVAAIGMPVALSSVATPDPVMARVS
jgi:hypothetical protein